MKTAKKRTKKTAPVAPKSRQNSNSMNKATSPELVSESVWPPDFVPFAAAIDDGRADAQAIRSGVYWTVIRTGGVPQGLADAWGVTPCTRAVPHEGFIATASRSPVALLAAMRKRGTWCADDFNQTDIKIGRIEKTPGGFTATFFDTYREACEAHALSK